MKKTIYELIGMIKDNNAPKRILWKDEVFNLVGNDYDDENDYSIPKKRLLEILGDKANE